MGKYKIVASIPTLLGIVGSSDACIENCYSWGNLIPYGFGISNNNAGYVKNCYTAMKSIKYPINQYGLDSGSYFDTEECGMAANSSNKGNATGLTTENMKKQESYVGWDFENIWYMDPAIGKPKLQWEKLIK